MNLEKARAFYEKTDALIRDQKDYDGPKIVPLGLKMVPEGISAVYNTKSRQYTFTLHHDKSTSMRVMQAGEVIEEHYGGYEDATAQAYADMVKGKSS